MCWNRWAVSCLLFVSSACAVDLDDADGIGRSDLAATTNNGRLINGRLINGRLINGVSLNGRLINGRAINGMVVNGSQLAGIHGDGELFAGDMVGAELTGTLTDGGSVRLRIDGSTVLAPPNDDVWAYDVKVALDDDTWAPLCGGAAGQPTLAIPLTGTWNTDSGVPGGGAWTDSPDTFTFACRGQALAKCVELGYAPWRTVGGVELRDHHQACTRMLRADYCGDGTPNTFDGWGLNVFDGLDIQTLAPGLDGWEFEAHWSADGAFCLTSYRAIDLIVSSELPACVAQRVSASCSETDFGDGSLIHNYFDPWGINVALQNAYTRYLVARPDLQGAMARIDIALDHLAQTPPKPRDAAQKVEEAVTKMKSALNKDLPATFGNDLMRRYALLVRSSLEFEIEKGVARYGASSSKVSAARKNLANGDALLTARNYPDAVNRFKNGIGNL